MTASIPFDFNTLWQCFIYLHFAYIKLQSASSCEYFIRTFCVLAHVCLVRYLHACCIHDISCALQQAGSQLPLLACRAGRKILSHPPLPFFLGGVVLASALSLDFAAGIYITCFSSFMDRAIVKRSGLMLVSISRREVGAF